MLLVVMDPAENRLSPFPRFGRKVIATTPGVEGKSPRGKKPKINNR
jgi:hypothetical protein